MKKFAIDATSALGPSGIERYTRSLLAELCGLIAPDELTVYAVRRRREQYQRLIGNATNIVLDDSFPHPLIFGYQLNSVLKRTNGIKFNRSAASVDLVHYTGDKRPPDPTTPFVQTIHDLFPLDDSLGLPAKLKHSFQRWVDVRLERARAILVPSTYTAEQIAEYKPNIGVPIVVTPLAADASFVPTPLSEHTRTQLNLGTRPFVLHVAREDPRKNLERQLRAFFQLPESVRGDLSFVVAGVGYATEKYSKMFENETQRGILKLFPSITQQQLLELLSSAVFLAFCSTAEGFGLPVIEAMQCGCPVLTSATTSLKEVAGDAAVIADPYNDESIANGMQHLIESDTYRSKLTEAGFKQSALFSWKRTAELTLHTYRQVTP